MVRTEMSVLEKSRDRLVLKTSRQRWLGGLQVALGVVCLTISLATGTSLAEFPTVGDLIRWLAEHPFWRGLAIALGAWFILGGFDTFTSSKTVTADRWRKAVAIETLYLGLWTHSSEVSFSQVESVELEHEHRESSGYPPHSWGGSTDTWTVYLPRTNLKRIKLCSGYSKPEQHDIALALGQVLGKTVIETEAGPGLLEIAHEEEKRRWLRPPPGDMP